MFTFTKKDIKLLKKWGYPIKDIAQMQAAMRIRGFIVFKDDKDKRVSRKKVINELGKREFLSGLSRACFHWDAYRKTDEGVGYNFDAWPMFKCDDEEKWDMFSVEMDKFMTANADI